MDEYIQYFVVNKELNMSPGKIAVQVAHASTMITYRKDYINNWIGWFNNDQKKIVLKGKEKDLLNLLNQLPY